MAARKEVEKAVYLREFQRTVSQLLSPEDKDYLFYAMKEYNTYKSVAKLMLALNSCLDTPEKLDLLPYVRDLIPKHDKKRFDSLAPYNRMAHPLKLNRATGDALDKLTNDSEGEGTEKSLRIVTLQRSPGSSLGFSIRGGREHDLGIFVSHVDSFSLAEQCGLQVGDQILAVNGISFDRLSHSSAVLILKSHDNLKIEVKNMGSVPGQKLGRDSFIWVDPSGNPVEEQSLEQPAPETEKREGESGSRLLSSIDRQKVVLHTDKKRPLGFSVRGGSEYGLGIYISMVDKESPADEAGLQVGDQIVDINGHSFASIFHQEAVYILRSYPTLMMTIKSLGKLPTLAPTKDNNQEETDKESNNETRRVRSFSLPRKFSFNASPLFKRKDEKEDKLKVSPLQRSHSTRERSLPAISGTDSVDSGAPSTPATGENKQKTSTAEFSSVHNRRKPIAVSPLATHESRASSSFKSPASVASKFFEPGIGSQVMLSSMSSQAKELLLDHARRKLDASDITTLKENLDKYEQSGDIKEFVDALIPLLDTPNKMKMLTDVRSVLNPGHIVDFDEMVSPLELQALQGSDSSESDSSEEDLLHDYNTALSTKEQQRWSKMLPLQSRQKKPSLPDLGVLGEVPRRTSLLKSSAVASSDPNLSTGHLRESTVGHHDREPMASKQGESDQAGIHHSYSFTKPSPVVVEIPKDSTFLGMAIKGGSDTPLKNIYVRELRQGGAVHNEGFVQPGFEVVQVDDKRIRGKTYSEAVESIAECYNSDAATIKLIVIPNQ